MFYREIGYALDRERVASLLRGFGLQRSLDRERRDLSPFGLALAELLSNKG